MPEENINFPPDTTVFNSEDLWHTLIQRAEEGSSFVGLLDEDDEALAFRLHLIRQARHSIELQTFILTGDETGLLVLEELVLAAQRGVHVRLLVDQLFSLNNIDILIYLAQAHPLFEIRLYNPTFKKAVNTSLEILQSLFSNFLRINHRLHNKFFLQDRSIAIIGGRNIDDRYFGGNANYNYRDREVWVISNECKKMHHSFELYWNHAYAVPIQTLRDVRLYIDQEVIAKPISIPVTDRVTRIRHYIENNAWIQQQLIARAFRVSRVEYYADPPSKSHRILRPVKKMDLSCKIREILGKANKSILSQTPYLLFSRATYQVLRRLLKEHAKIKIRFSTNSLAATDAFYVYAIYHKKKKKYLENLKLNIFEYKPFPPQKENDSMQLSDAEKPLAPVWRFKYKQPLPLKSNGIRRGLHAKSIVVDDCISILSSHNLDPRSEYINTESGVFIWDEAFAQALTRSIEEDISPQNSWVVAAQKTHHQFENAIGLSKIALKIISKYNAAWWKYPANFELKPGCEAVLTQDPAFYDYYACCGEFPQVNISWRWLYTRILITFDFGIEPVL